MNKAFEKIINRIDKEIPVYTGKAKQIVQEVAEEYNGGWIPCSEVLSEETGEYLTTSKIYFVPDHVDEIDNYVGVKISHYSTRCGWLDDEVIAWQPLPEPYQQKGE